METFYGILIPFLGTSLGAACVFFMKKSLSDRVQRSLTGFAAGVVVGGTTTPMELIDPRHRAIRSARQALVSAGSDRILDRRFVSAFA